MEETLYDKMLEAVYSTLDEETRKTCKKIIACEKLNLLQVLVKDTENTNANFRLKLIVKINELENQLL